MRSHFFVAPEYESILSANQLAGADDFFSLAGAVVRSVPGRATRRIELKSSGEKFIAYLKCCENGLESLDEWRQIHVLRELGFRTAAPIAAGWRRSENTGATQSFVMTAEIRDAVQGYEFWAASGDSQRRDFIGRIGDLARRFHGAGFIHKDFYLNHIFVTKRNNELELTLIDLQRVLGPRAFRTRWLVKDFGSMLFSLEKAGAKRATLLRLFKIYSGNKQSGAAEKNFLRKSLKRAAWLHGRKPKYGEPDSK